MRDEERFWIDQLNRKHECFSYDSSRHFEISVDGAEYSVVVPEYVTQLAPLIATRQDDLLFIVGNTDQLRDDRPLGFFIVARREDGALFSAVVCHQLYPYAIERLGLSNSASTEA